MMVAKIENELMRKVERAKESSGRRELRYILNGQMEKRGKRDENGEEPLLDHTESHLHKIIGTQFVHPLYQIGRNIRFVQQNLLPAAL